MDGPAPDPSDAAEPSSDAREPKEAVEAALPTKELPRPGSLDETITDPLKDVERDALTKIRKHEEAVVAIRSDIAALRDRTTGSTSVAELRRITAEANRLERLMKIPREILARDSLAQSEWPAADLAEARSVLAKVDACEAATKTAREQIAEEGDAKGCTPQSLSDALQQLVSSWYMLRSAERNARSSAALAVRRVDLSVDAQAATIGPLCDALLDKATELHARLSAAGGGALESDPESTVPVGDGVGMAVLAERLRAFVQLDWAKEALEALRVEVPSNDLFLAPPGGGSSGAGAAAEPREAAEDGNQGGGAPAAAPGAAAEDGAGAEGAAGAGPTGGPTADANADASAAEDASVVAAAAAATETASAPTTDVADPLLHTLPGNAAAWAGRSIDETLPSAHAGAAAAGSAELWRAVHVGDQATVEALIAKELCNARMRDASGHSVLWHAIAFNHVGLANLILDTFPPGTDRGAEVAEIHPRRGDSLLHLLCQSKTFGTQLAHLFKRIAAAAPPTLFQKVNRAGQTFFQIAASSLNFWVLTFVLRNFQVQARALVCMPNNAPMRNLAEVIAQPLPPDFAPPTPFPEHFRVADLLQRDEFGAVPYADVAFDVGPDNASVAAGRFLAHRIVVATQSPVLFEALEKLPLTDLPKESARVAIFRVDPRISQEVWRTALQFMYTGVINCAYADNVDKVLELFRACSMYRLPKPLLDFAQSCLYPLLPQSPPHAALQAFSICAGSAANDADLRPTREASTYIILRSAHRLFDAMEARETAQILERVVQTAEHSVFNPRKAPAGTRPRPAAPESADPLTQSLRRLPPDPLQSTQEVPRHDPLSQSLRNVSHHLQQHDPLSQSLRNVWHQDAQLPCGYLAPGAPAPGAQAYGRQPGTMPPYGSGPLGSMQLGHVEAAGGWR